MNQTGQIIDKCTARSKSRFDLWIEFVKEAKVKRMAEIGVYRGEFAVQLLDKCDFLEKYFMIDTWTHLEDWNKQSNKDNDLFEKFFVETKIKTDFAKDKRVILRGKTSEVINDIPDGTLDFIYIDGDHTLKGITIDLINAYPKIRNGGWIGGDDFSRSTWQHQTDLKPSQVFPFAIYFAEAISAKIYALPCDQFLIEKEERSSFDFVDLTGKYDYTSLKKESSSKKVVVLKLEDLFPGGK